MTGSDALDLEILGGVTGQLEDFGAQVFQNGGTVDGGGCTDAVVGSDAAFQVPVDTSDGELKSSLGGSRHRCLAGSLGLSLTSLGFSTLSFASFSGLTKRKE